MRAELLPGTTNVFRFPVERRALPTWERLADIQPDVRVVSNNAEAFELEMPPHDLRDQVDAATAEHIANSVAPSGPERAATLAEMLDSVVSAATKAAQDASDAGSDVSDAEQELSQAKATGQVWRRDALQARIDALALRMAELMITAHERAEQAAGVARAVELARRGEAWAPRDHNAEVEALLAVSRRG